MIISYINADVNSKKYIQWEEYLADTFGMFFCKMDDDIKILTEKNPIIIRDMINLYKPELFIVNSLKELPFSPTGISELIMFILNKGITFQSDEELIYFDDDKDILRVYPIVFNILKNKIK